MAVRESKLNPVPPTAPKPSLQPIEQAPQLDPPPSSVSEVIAAEPPASWQPADEAPVNRAVVVERLIPTTIAKSMERDVRHDGSVIGEYGHLYQPDTDPMSVPGLKPTNGKPIREKLVWVNGIMTPTELHIEDMQALAEHGLEVVGIHNATQGMFRDLSQCIADKLNLGRNPAVDTAVRTIRAALERNAPLHLVGHSQGALIIARALTEVRNGLLLENGASPEAARAALRSITVTTLGGASASYPAGPRYTHYLNDQDGVPMKTGLGLEYADPGEDAKVVRFSATRKATRMPAFKDGWLNYAARYIDRTEHGPQDFYIPRLTREDVQK